MCLRLFVPVNRASQYGSIVMMDYLGGWLAVHRSVELRVKCRVRRKQTCAWELPLIMVGLV
jgi:hypothetical protein